jgi:hypothetical protein
MEEFKSRFYYLIEKDKFFAKEEKEKVQIFG